MRMRASGGLAGLAERPAAGTPSRRRAGPRASTRGDRGLITRLAVTPQDEAALARLPSRPDTSGEAPVDYSKVVVKKPWGYEYLIFQNEAVAVWIMHLKPRAQTSLHCHRLKKTALVILEGEAVCTTLHEEIPRAAGEGLMIGPRVFHQTRAPSREHGVFVMEIESPVDKHDLVRARDGYGRVGKGYETIDKHAFSQNYNYLTLSEPAVYYNVTKRFGRCTIVLKRLAVGDSLEALAALDGHDVLSVLKGAICDADGRVLVEAGDTMTVADLNAVRGVTAVGGLELLIIKTRDTIVKLSDYVIGFLKSQGIREMFFAPGDANVHLIDSLGRAEELRYTCHQTERAAAMAAEAYGKLTGELGVLLISSGASGTNAMTGVANAWADSAPLLVISGQATADQPSEAGIRQHGNKSLRIVEMVTPITKYAVRVTDPRMIRAHLEHALRLARDGRPGPVWIDLPIEIQGMTIDEQDLAPSAPTRAAAVPQPAPGQVDAVMELLRSARRPALLAGHGIRIAGVHGRLLEWLARMAIPVLTSRQGADLIPDAHPLFFGRPGAYGQRHANFVIQNADLLLSIGARLSLPQIGRNYQAFARAAKKIVVDIDPEELKKHTVQADLTIQADAGAFLTQLLQALDRAPIPPPAAWLEQCRAWRAQFPPLAESRHLSYTFVNPYRFIDALSEALQGHEVLVVDGGPIMNYTMQTVRFKRGQRLIAATGIELPGFALAGAIGACVGNGRKPVICLCEDRGFQVGLEALQTIIDNRLPITIFVLKSQGYAEIRKIQCEYFGGRCVGTQQETVFGSPDLVKIGRIYGFRTSEVKSPDGLTDQIRRVLKAKGPVICDIQIDKDQELVPRIVFTVKPDGKWEARPLEDMYPFLDQATLEANMVGAPPLEA